MIRAVHAEVIQGLDTDSFINALMRFTIYREKLDHITIGCGTNFEGVAKELEILLCVKKKSITWKFNPLASPHMGGVWETIIRTVKEGICRIIKNTALTDYQLQTNVAEIEKHCQEPSSNT